MSMPNPAAKKIDAVRCRANLPVANTHTQIRFCEFLYFIERKPQTVWIAIQNNNVIHVSSPVPVAKIEMDKSVNGISVSIGE